MMMELRRGIRGCFLALLVIPLFAQPAKDSQTPDFAKGEFFIVSSIDLAKRQILLKRPTEVTELTRVDNGTHYFGEHGKPIRLTDLRAGDTVYIVVKLNGGQSVALTISKGPMTLDVLRERYLKRAK
jgi:hypothetical protein